MDKELLKKARLRLLQMHYEAGVGHIGGNLSALPIILELLHDCVGTQDAFVLSKGHAAGALYIAEWTLGHLTDEQLKTFHKDNTDLGGHLGASCGLHVGSLGHGLPLAVGMAMARKVRGGGRGMVYCLTSDGEWDEGSMWEAARLITEFDLRVNIAVDCNGLQGFKTVGSPNVLMDRFEAFGLAGKYELFVRPKGWGVSFMENKLEWHYLSMTKEQYDQACLEVSNA